MRLEDNTETITLRMFYNPGGIRRAIFHNVLIT